MATLAADEFRICSSCCEVHDLTSFRRRYRNRPDRMRVCNRCHAQSERLRRQRKKRQVSAMELQKLATAICRTRDEQRRAMLLRLGMAAAGGPENFLRNWFEVVSEMRARRQSGPRLLKFFELMWQYLLEQGQKGADVSPN